MALREVFSAPSRRSSVPRAAALAALVAVVPQLGCELVAAVDRSLIDGGAQGAPTSSTGPGEGGAGGHGGGNAGGGPEGGSGGLKIDGGTTTGLDGGGTGGDGGSGGATTGTIDGGGAGGGTGTGGAAGSGGTGGAGGGEVGCKDDLDCADLQNPDCGGTCDVPAGKCEYPAGKAVKAQIVGDCHQIQCAAQGGIKTVIDDADNNDQKSCTADKCDNGNPVHTNVAMGMSCVDAPGTTNCDSAGDCKDCSGADAFTGLGVNVGLRVFSFDVQDTLKPGFSCSEQVPSSCQGVDEVPCVQKGEKVVIYASTNVGPDTDTVRFVVSPASDLANVTVSMACTPNGPSTTAQDAAVDLAAMEVNPNPVGNSGAGLGVFRGYMDCADPSKPNTVAVVQDGVK